MKTITLSIIYILLSFAAHAQNKALDQIAAIVDEDIILESEIQSQVLTAAQSSPTFANPCDILDQMIVQKLLVAQAKKDSVVVSDERVNGELDRRMRYFVSLLGSEAAFEQYYGRTIEAYKEEFREEVRKQMMAQDVQQKIIGDVKVSPKEVIAYFNGIPKDSLPYINAEVEFEQIFIKTQISPEQEEVARVRLERLRQKLVEDTSQFRISAELKSDDPGSAVQGGRLGCFGRGKMVPEFERVAYTLKPGEISEVFKTQYGYHIMRVYNKVGEQVCAEHILFRVAASDADLQRCQLKADSIKTQIDAGNLSFNEAAQKFSDAESIDISNPQTGSSVFDMSTLGQFDPTLITAANDLKEGEIAAPAPFQNPYNGEIGFRMVRLKSQTEPHVLSLKQDYAKIQRATTEAKKVQIFQEWLEENRNSTYVKIEESYQTCERLKRNWLNN